MRLDEALTDVEKLDEYDKYFLKVALLTSELSRAVRKKVGAILVKDKRICSIGFNGTPHGFDNCCEITNPDGTLTTRPDVVHAEMNAILWCAKTSTLSINSTLYLTLSPCATCALAIIQSGIKRVVYIEEYRDTTGIDIIRKAGLQIEQKSI